MYLHRPRVGHGLRPGNPDRCCSGTRFHHEAAIRLGNRLESEVFVEVVSMVVDGVNDDHPAATDSDCLKGGSERLHEKPPSVACALGGFGDGETSEEIPGDHIGTPSGHGVRQALAPYHVGSDREVTVHLTDLIEPDVHASCPASVGVERRFGKPAVKVRVAAPETINGEMLGYTLERGQLPRLV